MIATPSAWAVKFASEAVWNRQDGESPRQALTRALDAARAEGRREMADACVTAATPGLFTFTEDAAEHIRLEVSELRAALAALRGDPLRVEEDVEPGVPVPRAGSGERDDEEPSIPRGRSDRPLEP
jgi:hypothetical protein